ncbi:MAG: hypothetical protein K2R98_04145 [Gemmataceae bacterium]|nr:hypothetical protein [Gemmataceae bacterium]
MAKFPSSESDKNRTGGKPSLRQSMNMGSNSRAVAQADEPETLSPNSTPQDPYVTKSAVLAALASQKPHLDPQKMERLRAENDEMRGIIAELRELLEARAAQGSEGWEVRVQEFEDLMEVKSEEIRCLHMRLHELEQEHASSGQSNVASSANVSNSDRSALREELEMERMQLEEERQKVNDERQQVRAEEEDLETRMQEMELQMAKSRADLVRQRNELQQLHNQVRSELEAAQKTGAVNERMKNLQRQHQEVTKKK